MKDGIIIADGNTLQLAGMARGHIVIENKSGNPISVTVEVITPPQLANTGKSFRWAIKNMKKGRNVRESWWDDDQYMKSYLYKFLDQNGMEFELSHSSILSTYWELYTP